LIEIKDYDTSSDVGQTTRCTFIKVLRAQTNQLIDYGAFGYGGLAGGTAGGLTGTPLDQAPRIALGGGTTITDTINWQLIDRINLDKNKLVYNISLVDTPIQVPLDEYVTPLIELHNENIANLNDLTLSIQNNVNKVAGGEIIYLTDAEYPAGSTIGLTLEEKRMLIQTDLSTYTGTTFTEITLPIIDEDIYDGYSFEMVVDTNKGGKFIMNYFDSNGDQIDLYTSDDPLIIDPVTISSIKFTYWEGSDKYLQTVICVC
jgi:hypothetical protein